MVRKMFMPRENKKEKREESEIGDLTTAIVIIRMVSNMKLSLKKKEIRQSHLLSALLP